MMFTGIHDATQVSFKTLWDDFDNEMNGTINQDTEWRHTNCWKLTIDESEIKKKIMINQN